MTISVVIHTCDESRYIEECLKSVAWADEIVIIDMESKDNTVELCRGYTEKIYTHPRLPTADSARNFGLSKATGDWILVLDPDERVSKALSSILKKLAVTGDADGYVLPFATWMFGREIHHTGWGGDRHLRFFRKGTVTWPGHVHLQPTISGPVETISREEGCIDHINYESVSQFVEKMNRYTTLEAGRLKELDRPFHWLKLFYQPAKEFFARFFRQRGYKDGLVGLILSLMMALYTQVAYVKLWELYDREERQVER